MICRICAIVRWLALTVIIGMLAIGAHDFVTVSLRQWRMW